MTHPHTFAPHLSTYAAKAHARARQVNHQPQPARPTQGLGFTAQELSELCKAERIHAEDLHAHHPKSWKAKYKVGQTVTFNDSLFIIVAVTRRGLVLHHINQKL